MTALSLPLSLRGLAPALQLHPQQIAPCGTGDTEILIDESMLKEVTNFANESLESTEDTEICENLSFDFVVPNIDKSAVRPAKVWKNE
jgi:hypothetical protein